MSSLTLLLRRHARFIVDKHKTGSWHIRTLPFSTIRMETGTHALVCCFDDVRLGNREIENTDWKKRVDEHLSSWIVCSCHKHQLISVERVWNDSKVFEHVTAVNVDGISIRTVSVLNALPVVIASEILPCQRGRAYRIRGNNISSQQSQEDLACFEENLSS